MSSESLHLDPALDLQVRTSKMLGLGIAFSIWPYFGIAAVFIGLKCAGTIYFSDIRIRGRVAVWWCLIIGIVQTIVAINMMSPWIRLPH